MPQYSDGYGFCVFKNNVSKEKESFFHLQDSDIAFFSKFACNKFNFYRQMKKFTCVQDIGNLKTALDEAFEIKKDRFKYVELGRNKTLMMIFLPAYCERDTGCKLLSRTLNDGALSPT